MSCDFFFPRHFTDDMGLMHFSVFFSLCRWHGSLRFLGMSENSHVICRYYRYVMLFFNNFTLHFFKPQYIFNLIRAVMSLKNYGPSTALTPRCNLCEGVASIHRSACKCLRKIGPTQNGKKNEITQAFLHYTQYVHWSTTIWNINTIKNILLIYAFDMFWPAYTII